MRMVEEMKPMFLYPASKKIHIPIDPNERRKNSAILLLAPDFNGAMKLTQLPYVFNPKLFVSYFIDRNVMAYINSSDDFEVDLAEDESLSEAISGSKTTKIIFDTDMSPMNKNRISAVINLSNINKICKDFRISHPEKMYVKVHDTLGDLRRELPNGLREYEDDLFSFSTSDTCHILSWHMYNESDVGYSYDIYLKNELDNFVIRNINPDMPYTLSRGIVYAYEDITSLVKKEYNNIPSRLAGESFYKNIKILDFVRKPDGIRAVSSYLNTGDVQYLSRFIKSASLSKIRSSLFESTLSYYERQRLLPYQFGIPEKRKYPMPDADHVRAAVRMFNNCDPDDEEQLAKAIIKKMEYFGIDDIKVSAANRFKKYYHPKDDKNKTSSKNESTILESATFNSDIDLYNWMHSNIKYSTYSILKTPNELYKEKCGSCHDQVLFEIDSLRRINGCTNIKGWFIIEYNDDKGGETHSVVTYTKNNKNYYFENAWKNNAGIHILNETIESLFDKFHKDGKWGNYNKYPNIEVSSFNATPGMNLQELVDSCLNNVKNESVMADIDIMCQEDPRYRDVIDVCNSLSSEEFKKISFYDTYKNSDNVIYRRIEKDYDGTPKGFIDVYWFETRPEIAQIVIAVNPKYRDQGVADKLVKEMLWSHIENEYHFNYYYWTAHFDNIASQRLALKNGFEDIHETDRYDRKIFIKKVNSSIISFNKELVMEAANFEGVSSFSTDSGTIVLEADEYSRRLKQYIYKERIKNNKDVLMMYDVVKSTLPWVRKAYPKIDMYKRANIFVDLSYYHGIFLKRNKYRLDKAVNFYADFIHRLLNNSDINSNYSRQTVFIPVDAGTWPVEEGTELSNYRKNLNPISIIYRLVRTNPEALRNTFRNKDVLFVGTRGYFKVDFNDFNMKKLQRFKINLRKLMSATEPIVDDFEKDDITDSDTEDADTTAGMTSKIIDRVEKSSSIEIDDISSVEMHKPEIKTDEELENEPLRSPSTQKSQMKVKYLNQHMKITRDPIKISKSIGNNDLDVVVLNIDPSGPDKYENIIKTPLKDLSSVIDTYYLI